MRTEDEIQRAHDLLLPIVTGEVPPGFVRKTGDLPPWHAALDVLCWVLGPDHNDQSTAFADNMVKLERYLADHGVVLTRGGAR